MRQRSLFNSVQKQIHVILAENQVRDEINMDFDVTLCITVITNEHFIIGLELLLFCEICFAVHRNRINRIHLIYVGSLQVFNFLSFNVRKASSVKSSLNCRIIPL